MPHAALRRLSLLLVVAWGAPAAHASYVYERSFPAIPGWHDVYLMSFPEDVGLRDVANSSASWGDKCDLRGVGGDGVLNSDDAICTFWGDGDPRARAGSFALAYIDDTGCTLITRQASATGILGVVFQGVPFPIDPHRGYFVLPKPPRDATSPVPNRGTLVGECETFPGVMVGLAPCRRLLLTFPAEATWTRAIDVLCGSIPSSWVDTNRNGWPDEPGACVNGLYDPTSGQSVAVSMFDNVPGSNEFSGTDNSYVSLVARKAFGNVQFQGYNFLLQPGDSYLFNIGSLPPAYQPRWWQPPQDLTQTGCGGSN